MLTLAAEWSWSYCHNLFIPQVQMNPLWGSWRKLMTLFAVSWVSTTYKWKTQLSHWATHLDRKNLSYFCLSRLCTLVLYSEVAGIQLLKLLMPAISWPSPPGVMSKCFRNTESGLTLFTLFLFVYFNVLFMVGTWLVSYVFILNVSIYRHILSQGWLWPLN